MLDFILRVAPRYGRFATNRPQPDSIFKLPRHNTQECCMSTISTIGSIDLDRPRASILWPFYCSPLKFVSKSTLTSSSHPSISSAPKPRQKIHGGLARYSPSPFSGPARLFMKKQLRTFTPSTASTSPLFRSSLTLTLFHNVRPHLNPSLPDESEVPDAHQSIPRSPSLDPISRSYATSASA